ncbi:pyocin activator PrtN family protein [Xenorhabdus sp. M]|uniref:Pyocin activator PrtN family protein n=1 Tax=Xenorhabdus szentirmaii TaxID=290112 RepID=A0AAW3YSB2_9GAMM|nr:pyocin activator PrtN family protein [Xenorhabdus sp. M]MBD2799866.1 pyocin activator PrtN family protein [Xenorhabdus sp. M]
MRCLTPLGTRNFSIKPLSTIAEKYLKLYPTTAERKANKGKLKIPAYKMNDNQKSPRIVHESDLANYIDEQRELSAKKRRKDTVSKEISERTRQKLSGCYHFSTPYIM